MLGLWWHHDAAPVKGRPSYQTCLEATAYAHRVKTLDAGDQFCVRTTGGRYSWVKFVRVQGEFQVEIITWESPGT